MFSLQRLLGKEDKFFNLLEGSAQESRTSVQALIRFMKNQDELKTLDEFILARRKEKKIYDEAGDQEGSTINYNTGKLEVLGRDYDTTPARPHSFYAKKYCEINDGNPHRFIRERNTEGFAIIQSNCTTGDTPPAGWDLTVSP